MRLGVLLILLASCTPPDPCVAPRPDVLGPVARWPLEAFTAEELASSRAGVDDHGTLMAYVRRDGRPLGLEQWPCATRGVRSSNCRRVSAASSGLPAVVTLGEKFPVSEMYGTDCELVACAGGVR